MTAGQATDHERLVEEVVRCYFDALDTSDSTEEGGMGSQREAVENDLKRLDPEDFYRSLKRLERVLSRSWNAVYEMDYVASAVLADTENRVRAALERVEEARGSQA